MQVLKFGGTSVADAASMSQCADIIADAVARDNSIVVVSAIAGFTDALIKIGKLASEKDESYKDILDEYISVDLREEAAKRQGFSCVQAA